MPVFHPTARPIGAWLFVLVITFASTAWLGCDPSLGPCDPDAAREVVYDDHAEPIYAGQAQLHGSCGFGAFCHASDARDEARWSAPLGLDFDVAPVSYDAAIDTIADGEIERLATARAAVIAHRSEIWQQILSGGMPPDFVGRDLLESPLRPRYRRDSAHSFAALPELDSDEGRETFRNWLACGAVVVERSRPPADGLPPEIGDEVPLASCESAADCPFSGRPRCDLAMGRCAGCVQDSDCMMHGRLSKCEANICVEPVPPTFEAIHRIVITPHCAVESCHGGARGPEEGIVDLRGRSAAYDQLLLPSESEACGSTNLPGVTPGDPAASLLFRKIQPDELGAVICGDPMPSYGASLPRSWVDAIEAWIQAGAPGP